MNNNKTKNSKLNLWLAGSFVILLFIFVVYVLWYRTTMLVPDQLVTDEFVFMVDVDDIHQTSSLVDRPNIQRVLTAGPATLGVFNTFNKMRTQINQIDFLWDIISSIPVRMVVYPGFEANPVIISDLGLKSIILRNGINTLPLLVSTQPKLRVDVNTVRGNKVYELRILEKRTSWYFTVLKNLLVFTNNRTVLDRTINLYTNPPGNLIHQNSVYLQIKTKITGKNVIRTYFPADKILTFTQSDSAIYKIVKSMELSKFLGLGISLGNEIVQTDFFVPLESQDKLFQSTGSELSFTEILPQSAGFMFGIRVDKFTTLWSYIKTLSAKEENFTSQLSLIEKIFTQLTGKTVEKGLLSLIGNEIGVAYLPVNDKLEQVLLFNLNNSKETKSSFTELEKSIAAQIYLGVEKIKFKEHEITKLNHPFFLRILLGIFIKKQVEMYYTITENYLVCTTRLEPLKQFLDNLGTEMNVSGDEKYWLISTRWFDRGNVYCFWSRDISQNLVPQENVYISRIFQSYPIGGISLRFTDRGIGGRLILTSPE